MSNGRGDSKYPETKGDWIEVTRLGDVNAFRFIDSQSSRKIKIYLGVDIIGRGFPRKDGWIEWEGYDDD